MAVAVELLTRPRPRPWGQTVPVIRSAIVPNRKNVLDDRLATVEPSLDFVVTGAYYVSLPTSVEGQSETDTARHATPWGHHLGAPYQDYPSYHTNGVCFSLNHFECSEKCARACFPVDQITERCTPDSRRTRDSHPQGRTLSY